MKTLFKALLVAAAATSLLALASCSDDDDDDNNASPNPTTLPSSVGANEFNGKTWKQSGEGWAETIAFSSETCVWSETYTEDNGSEKTWSETRKYTYDSEKKLLNMVPVSFTSDGVTVMSVDEYVAQIKKEAEEQNEAWSDARAVYERANSSQVFTSKETYQYSISSDGKTLTLTENYFDGTFPTAVEFEGDVVSFKHDSIRIESGSDTYKIFSTYTNGTFSGTVFNRDTYAMLGTASGTYTPNGTGTSGCTVTITFTSLPSGITTVQTGKAYTITQYVDSKGEDIYTSTYELQ